LRERMMSVVHRKSSSGVLKSTVLRLAFAPKAINFFIQPRCNAVNLESEEGRVELIKLGYALPCFVTKRTTFSKSPLTAKS